MTSSMLVRMNRENLAMVGRARAIVGNTVMRKGGIPGHREDWEHNGEHILQQRRHHEAGNGNANDRYDDRQIVQRLLSVEGCNHPQADADDGGREQRPQARSRDCGKALLMMSTTDLPR